MSSSLRQQNYRYMEAMSKFWEDGGLKGPHPGVTDPVPMQRFVTEDAYIHQGIGTSAAVMYDGRRIGPSGGIMNNQSNTIR